MACFANINVSQGSVATYAKCSGNVCYECMNVGMGMLNIHLTTNLPRNLPVNFFNRLTFDRIMVMSLWPHFFGPPCRLPRQHTVNSWTPAGQQPQQPQQPWLASDRCSRQQYISWTPVVGDAQMPTGSNITWTNRPRQACQSQSVSVTALNERPLSSRPTATAALHRIHLMFACLCQSHQQYN